MQRIDSALNPKLKRVRKFTAGERDGWIVEGLSLFEDAVDSGVSFEEVFVTPGTLPKVRSLPELERKGVKVYEISASIMKKLSTLKTPPGILGIARPAQLQEYVDIVHFASLLLSVRDPGNMGTLIRSAEAAGCEFVACSPDCAEPHQPKVVRGSMGSIFRVPSFKIRDTAKYIEEVKQRGVSIYGLYPRGGTELRKITPRYPALIVIGGEGAGIPEEIATDEKITIAMKGRVESLNTATAGALCLYHFQRAAE